MVAESRRQAAEARTRTSAQAGPTPNPEQMRELSLKALIDDALISDFAVGQGITITDEMVNVEMTRAVAARGGVLAFQLWLRDTQLTLADVRTTARREVMGRATRNVVLRNLPTSGEYLHLAHILVASETEARTLLAQVKSGADFAALAQALSLDSTTRGAGGDLGWIAAGSGALAWPEIEQAVATSDTATAVGPIRTPIGYHVARLLGRENRPYRSEDAARLSQRAISRWMADLRARATIEVYP